MSETSKSEPLFWLVRGGERYAVVAVAVKRGNPEHVACQTPHGRLTLWGSGSNHIVFPNGAEVRPAKMPTTTNEAAALIRALALPVGGYEVRERVTAGAWNEHGERVYAGTTQCAARLGIDGDAWGWRCWLRFGAPDVHGPETGDAGKAAADAWLTANAPWVVLEGGAFVVPPALADSIPIEPGSDADWTEALRVVQAAHAGDLGLYVREDGRPAAVKPPVGGELVWIGADGAFHARTQRIYDRTPATATEAAHRFAAERAAVPPLTPERFADLVDEGQALRRQRDADLMAAQIEHGRRTAPVPRADHDALAARVAALEAGRLSPVGLLLSVEPIPFGDGDGFAVLVTLPSGRCLSVDRDSDRCLTVERDMHRKYRTQREVDSAVRYWRGVFGLGVSP